MAYLHACSGEGKKSELDLVTLPLTQTSIESSAYLYYKPISSLSDDGDSPLEFLIPSSTDHYTDLAHTMLHLTVQILPASDTPSENLKVGPFHRQTMRIHIEPTYRVETLLNYVAPAMRAHLTSALWSIDTADAMDAAPNLDRNADGANQCLINRHLYCDVFNQPKFLINGVDVRVRLVRSKDTFCLNDWSDNGKFSVHIKKATLIVRRAKISPGILLAHANALAKTTAKYPLRRAEVKSFTLHSGILGDTLDNVILGQLPKRIILGFVKNKAFQFSTL
ncbi:uncharacterized protein F54H12.2-like [Nasonia vitripennis]|uniref:Uncharacterized protein n=1 Tax=Nasonia vitripennis TaxID=7425 RepID=A0A7M7M7S8_NASVI|nr:uncharacterized protein F54H12.2-like [Nasonia vitripennis]